MGPFSVDAITCRHRGDWKTPLSGPEVDPAPICGYPSEGDAGQGRNFLPDFVVHNSSGKISDVGRASSWLFYQPYR